MRVVIFGAAIALAVTGVAVAKEKKPIVAQNANGCSASHVKASKSAPKLDCKSTGTVAQSSDGSANARAPTLGYDTSPWFVPTSF
jgi:hypothetical protein